MKHLLILLLLVIAPSVSGSEGHEILPHHIVSVRWNEQGDYYATGYIDGSIRIYYQNVLTIEIPNAHSDVVPALAFNSDSSRLATGGYDGSVKVWNTQTGNIVGEIAGVEANFITVFWYPDDSYIWAVAATGKDVLISANIASDTYLLSQRLRVTSSDDVVWKPDNSLIAFAGSGSDIVIVNPLSQAIVRQVDVTPDANFLEPPNEFSISLAWHPTLNIVADGKINGWIEVWDLDSPSDNIPLLRLQANDNASDSGVVPFLYGVEDIIFSADGETISSVSSDGTLRTWDATTGELLIDSNLGEDIISAAFSPDGSQLVYNTFSPVDIPPILIEFPTANAGADQTLTADAQGNALVTLDGSASTDSDGTIVSYVWTENSVEIATGATPQVTLSVGTHTIVLTVTDDDGASATDVVLVTVEEAAN